MPDGTERVSYQPTDGLSYDPTEPVYWDAAGLNAEVERVFEVCHGCRMCFKYCDAFPTLFELIDDAHAGAVRQLTADDRQRVFSQCFQCKLCEVQCPFTPRESHTFQLDFPKLVHRWNAQRFRESKPGLGRRLLANPDRVARLARGSFGLANALNRVSLHRWFLQKALSIHRKKLLPPFVGTTFEKWADHQGLIHAKPGGEAVLFQTCYVQNNEPEIGRDTVDVMQRNGVDIRCAKGLACCGMPAWEQGDLQSVRAAAANNLDQLMPFVEAGAQVLAVNPTCSMMLRRELPKLLEGADRERATRLATAVKDPGEYLWSLRDEPRFNTDFRSTPGEDLAYHAPCHLRAQAIGFRGRDLLRKIPGVVPRTTTECCGHDGTYAMTTAGFEASKRIGRKAFAGLQQTKSEVWVTDCPLAALQFQQHAGRKPMHPMTVLARAYREDGFETPLPAAEPRVDSPSNAPSDATSSAERKPKPE